MLPRLMTVKSAVRVFCSDRVPLCSGGGHGLDAAGEREMRMAS